MAFYLRRDEYFRGSIVEPDGERRVMVVMGRSTRAVVVPATVVAASRRGWDWQFQLLRDEKDGAVTELARWSEIAGDALPPPSRAQVPSLQLAKRR
jgi:hypothetical protein